MDQLFSAKPSVLACIAIWRILRRPFALPPRLAGHVCSGHWEAIDIDIAGCRVCGLVHVCIDSPASATQTLPPRRVAMARDSAVFCGLGSIHAKCVLVFDDCEGNHVSVCDITGYCVREKMFVENEFTETVAVQLDHSPRSRPVNRDLVHCFVSRLLVSDEAERCQSSECVRANSKLEGLFVRLVKDFKMQFPATAPNLVMLASELATRSRNIRLGLQRFDHGMRTGVANACTDSMMILLMTLYDSCPHVLHLTKMEVLVTGLLYLMRSGLNMQGVVLLPSVPVLHVLLPHESSLQPFFGMKSKCITEVENVVKVHLRGLDSRVAHRMCLQNTGETSLQARIPR